MNEQNTFRTQPGAGAEPATVRVWDPLVRVFHWSLVVTFAIASVTAELSDRLHEVVGYTVLGLVVFRIVWGVVGTRHARFGDFVYKPAAVTAYLRDVIAFRARRYIGHNPAGGAMIVAMLVALTVAGVTGWMLTLESYRHAGWMSDLHAFSANASLWLVAGHIAGVALASWQHHENLVRAMINGRKRV